LPEATGTGGRGHVLLAWWVLEFVHSSCSVLTEDTCITLLLLEPSVSSN
jgi:hypothetical protein